MATLPVYKAQRTLDVGSAQQISVDRSRLARVDEFGGAVQQAGLGLVALSEHQRKRDEQKEEFKAAQDYQQMQTELGADYDTILEGTPEDGTGFHDGMMVDGFKKRADAFTAELPERLRERYGEVLQTDLTKWSTTAAKEERGRLYANSARVIGEQQNTFLNSISLDADSFDESFNSGMAIIDAAPIPEDLKAKARRDWEASALTALAGKMIEDDPHAAKKALGGGTPSRVNFAAPVNDAIETASAKHGVDANAMKVIAYIESKGKPGAKNPKSSAGGLYQFIDSTAKQYGLRDKYDANQASDAAARLMSDNATGLRKVLGREPSVGELYLAHQQGLGGATKLLSNPNAKAVNVVGEQAVKLNGGAPGMTAGQFAQLWTNKADKIAGKGGKIDAKFAGMDVNTRQKALNVADQAITQQQTEATQALASQKGAFQLAIATNDAGLTVQDILDSRLKDSDKAQLVNSLESAQKEERSTAQYAARIMEGGGGFDPYGTKDRKGVDGVYEKAMGGKDLLADQGAQEFAQYVFDQTGILPKGAINQLRRGVGSTDPQQVAAAASIAANLQDSDTDKLLGARSGGSELEKAATTYNHMTQNLGYSIDEAGEKMAAMNDPQTRREREALLDTEMVKKAVKEINVNEIENEFDTLFGESGLNFQPRLGRNEEERSIALAEYRDIFKESVASSNGDIQLAKALTNEQFRKSYGLSSFAFGGDETIIRNPVENSYPAIAGSYEWITEQIKQDLIADGFTFDLSLDELNSDAGNGIPETYINPDSIVLQPSPETEAAVNAGRPPSYQLHYVQGGVLKMYPGAFQPNYDAAITPHRQQLEDRYQARREVVEDMTREIELGIGAPREAFMKDNK